MPFMQLRFQLFSGISETMGCNHRRAQQLSYSDFEMFGDCQTVGYQCDDYDDFLEGKCADCGEDGTKCELMGTWTSHWEPPAGYRHASKLMPKKMFIVTGSGQPYCCKYLEFMRLTNLNGFISSVSLPNCRSSFK